MILITGGTGHLGNVLVKQFINLGEKPVVYTHPSDTCKSLNNVDVEIVKADIRDKNVLEKYIKESEAVFHLAAVISILPWKSKAIEDVNVGGTKNVADLCMKYNKKLIYVSSVHAFSEKEEGDVIDEKTPILPELTTGAYGKSKAKAALLIMNYAKAGLNVITICPTGIIGPFDYKPSEMGNMFLSYLKGELNTIIEGAFDFVDVRDVSDGIIKAYEKGNKGEFYILGNENIEVFELISMVNTIKNKDFQPKILGKNTAYFVSILLLLKNLISKEKLLLTPYSVHTLQTNTLFSHEKAARELGYNPRPLEETVKDTVTWLENNLM
jgi:dihydroflavonol-4-reductase